MRFSYLSFKTAFDISAVANAIYSLNFHSYIDVEGISTKTDAVVDICRYDETHSQSISNESERAENRKIICKDDEDEGPSSTGVGIDEHDKNCPVANAEGLQMDVHSVQSILRPASIDGLGLRDVDGAVAADIWCSLVFTVAVLSLLLHLALVR